MMMEVVEIQRREGCCFSDKRFVMRNEVTLYARQEECATVDLLGATELLCNDRRFGDGALEQGKSLAGSLPLTLAK